MGGAHDAWNPAHPGVGVAGSITLTPVPSDDDEIVVSQPRNPGLVGAITDGTAMVSVITPSDITVPYGDEDFEDNSEPLGRTE